MKNRILILLWSMVLLWVPVSAQQMAVTGKITTAEEGLALPGVSIIVKGTNIGTSSNADGLYTLNAERGQVLVYSFIGMTSVERTVGSASTINVAMAADAKSLNEVVVTALGIAQEKTPLPYSVTTVQGATLAQTQRENFINGLAGRVAGVDVTATSGIPGSSSSIMIRGVSSLSGSNQPLFVVDGLPINNSSFNTGALASASNTATSFENRTTDFSNRGADINPEDIESITILKGPEAAALYGIDAASGAIVITTKRGKAGAGQINYSNSFRIDKLYKFPETQRVYDRGASGVSDEGTTIVSYFGSPYPEGTQFYDNVGNFFQDAFTQKHNLSFSGGSERSTYRIAGSYTGQEGVVPGTSLDKLNISSAITSTLNKLISTDLSFNYTYSDNQSAFKGAGGPLLGVLGWPSTDDASVYLTPTGGRRLYSSSSSEIENPFFNVNKNINSNIVNRFIINSRISIDPTSWLKFVGNVGFDYGNERITLVRHQESDYGKSRGGIFDQANSTSRIANIQYYAQFLKTLGKFHADLKLGSAVKDENYYTQAVTGESFLAPDLYSIENTDPTKHRGKNTLTQRRLVGAFGNLILNYDKLVFLTFSGRNDWSSTLPKQNNSFFYPSAGVSFVFTELAPFASLSKVLSFGKIRGSIAQVGKDAPPYKVRTSLESAPTTGGGFRYSFTGPSSDLRPEMTTSYEFGTELKFFNNRFGIDATYFNKKSVDQIVANLRLSYGTGFVLQAYNAGEMKTEGIGLQLNATPVMGGDFSWDILANFTHLWSQLVRLPEGVTEYYNSDTWLAGNVRGGARVGGPLTTLTGYDYLRNDKGEILIDLANGYPLRNTTDWVIIGDRQPDFTMGLTNNFNYKNFSLSFLLDIRKGGDIYNATEHWLTLRGLSMRTLDRENPKIFQGVLKDGYENTDNPTRNGVVVDPSHDAATFYSGTNTPDVMFIEKDVNWVRLRDVTFRYNVPAASLQRVRFVKTGSVFVTGTDLFLATNYSGLDPVVNGNSAATGGSGGAGVDFGNLPLPMGINFGVTVGF